MNKEWNQQFDFEEPLKGHQNRFEQKLKQQKRTSNSGLKYLLVAASILFFITLGYWIKSQIEIKPNTIISSTNYLSNCNNEIQELSAYYTSIESQKMEAIINTGIDSTLFLKEIANTDSIVETFCKELNAQSNDERVIEAVIMHYQLKINTLDHILNQIKQIKHFNTKENESINL
ncbi:MAG: hypothetical protein JXR60_01170 [Bacteroidales bacterium]|nr:hypothetical protein [Bacteroidales bacterium]